MNVCLVLNDGKESQATPLPVDFKYWPLLPFEPPTFIVLSNCIGPAIVEIPVALKLRVTISSPIIDVDADPDEVNTLIPLTKRLLPSKRKLLLSSNSPPDPARTTLPDVKSSTLNVFACPPASISNNPAVVVTPAIRTLSNSVWPSTSISPFKSIPVAVILPMLYVSVPVPTLPFVSLLTNSNQLPAWAKYPLPVAWTWANIPW